MPQKKTKKSNYYFWTNDKFGREVYWEKHNLRSHQNYHEVILTEESTFIDTLSDPDKVYSDKDYGSARTCFYKYEAFEKEDGKKKCAQVVVIENYRTKHPPTKNKYVIVATAMDRDYIPEERLNLTPKYVKEQNDE